MRKEASKRHGKVKVPREPSLLSYYQGYELRKTNKDQVFSPSAVFDSSSGYYYSSFSGLEALGELSNPDGTQSCAVVWCLIFPPKGVCCSIVVMHC